MSPRCPRSQSDLAVDLADQPDQPDQPDQSDQRDRLDQGSPTNGSPDQLNYPKPVRRERRSLNPNYFSGSHRYSASFVFPPPADLEAVAQTDVEPATATASTVATAVSDRPADDRETCPLQASPKKGPTTAADTEFTATGEFKKPLLSSEELSLQLQQLTVESVGLLRSPCKTLFREGHGREPAGQNHEEDPTPFDIYASQPGPAVPTFSSSSTSLLAQ